MSRFACPLGGMSQGFPRVSGDEPAIRLQVQGAREFSPRERG